MDEDRFRSCLVDGRGTPRWLSSDRDYADREMAIDKTYDLQAQGKEAFLIYEEDLEESAQDPCVKAFLEESWAEFKRLEAEGRIIY